MYGATYQIPFLINRFGCIAGPWQMGKTDQGVFTLWVYRHIVQKPLTYIGYGGQGKQVRDFIHIDDVCEIIGRQLEDFENLSGELFNVGGGRDNSLSLQELTQVCQKVVGQTLTITADPETRPVDLKNYISDNSRIQRKLQWQPQRTIQ